MNHQQIEQQDIVKRYVLHKLPPAERRAFQEHYFECEECFERVQMAARIIADVRQVVRKGALAESVAEPRWKSLFRPAPGFAVALAMVLALAFGWLLLKRDSATRQELAIEQSPSPPPQPTATPGTETTPTTTTGERPKLQDQPDLLAQNRQTRTPDVAPGKPPVVFLDSERDASGGNQLTLPPNAASAILRIEVEPGSSFSGFQFQVFDSSKRLVTTATSGRASATGAVTASLSTRLLQNGKYVVKCYGLREGQRELVGEYRLQVQKL
jgi:hypothetical protein